MGVAPAEIEGGDGTTLATVDSFSTDPVVREALAKDAHLVDMEGFAVLATLGHDTR